MRARNVYIMLGVIFGASVMLSILLPLGDTIRGLAAIPAIGSLCGALLEIFRDRIAHERALLVLEAQNSFAIGATSHMAAVAFDKYALFCEEYVAEMFKALMTLAREGPHKTALSHASSLLEVRRKWAVWLTPQVETELQRFEVAIRRIGANAHFLESVPGESAAIQEMYSLFAEVVGLDNWDDKPITGDLTVAAVIDKLRRVLGIDELSLMRSKLINRALHNVQNSG